MARATPKSFIIIRFPLAVLLCSAAPVALSVDFSCGAGPNVNHSVDATPFTVYQIEGQNILLVPAGTVSKFVAWQSRAQNSNTTTDISPGTGTKFQYEVFSLRILSMTSDLNGTQFRYITSESLFGKVIFISNWTTTIIGHQPIIEVPKEVIIEEGKEKKIMINISGLPRPQNSTCWNDSSAEEVDSGRFKCELEHLMIGPLFESDEGQYTVEARNCFGLQTAQMNITVHRPPSIMPKFTDHLVMCHGDFNLSYMIDGDPKPDHQWHFKGSPVIQPPSQLIIRDITFDDTQLIIRDITFNDTGLYTLKVNNSVDQKNDSFMLSLREMEGGTLKFTQKPSTDPVDCMGPLILKCAATGPNITTIYWDGNIQNISDIENRTLFDQCGEKELISTLTVNNHSEFHWYNFICHVTNTSSRQPVISAHAYVLCAPGLAIDCSCTSCTIHIECHEELLAEVSLTIDDRQLQVIGNGSHLCNGSRVEVYSLLHNGTTASNVTVMATVRNKSLDGNQSNPTYKYARTRICPGDSTDDNTVVIIVSVVVVVGVIVSLIVIVVWYRSRSVSKPDKRGGTTETDGVPLASGGKHKVVPHDTHVDTVHYAASGPDAKTEEEQCKTHATSSGAKGAIKDEEQPEAYATSAIAREANKYEEQPEAYATSAIARGATASAAKQQQPEAVPFNNSVHSQPTKGKKGASKNVQTGPSGETYALPDMAKKKKKGDTVQVPTDQYAKIDKDKKDQKQGLHYADLEKGQLKGSTNPRMSQSVTYSEVNEVQPPPKTE